MAASGTLDPSARGTPIKVALVIEAIATLASGAAVIARPNLLLAHLAPATSITPLALLLTQLIGVLSLVFGIFCTVAVPNTRSAVTSRPTLYWVLGLGEFAVCLLLFWHLLFRDEDAAAQQGDATRQGLWKGVQQMAPVVIWRTFVLVFKPHWFGRWIDHDKRA